MHTILDTKYDSRKSFYGKAKIQDFDGQGGDLRLISYATHVATIFTERGTKKAQVYGTYSNTTLRHIKEFLKQNGFRAYNSKQIMEDYGV